MASPELPGSPKLYKWDVRVASPRKLFRDLRYFLDEHEYEHKSEPDAIDGLAIFKSELLGRKDTQRRDWAYLIFGIILLPTILLTTLGIRFIKQSRYTYRTVASIGVEGEAYLAKESLQDIGRSETLDVVSDARVTLSLNAGAARGDYGIWRPTDNKHDLTSLEEERDRLEKALSQYFAGTDRSGNKD